MRETVSTNKLTIRVYENAYVIRGEQVIFAYDENGRFIKNTSKRLVGEQKYLQVEDIDVNSIDNNTTEYEELLYIGFLRGHWGHFLVDSTVRMWSISKNTKTCCKILANIEGMDHFYSWWFEQFGIDINSDIIDPQGILRVKRLLVPDISYLPGKYIFKEFIYPFDFIKDKIRNEEIECEKLYLSRVHIAKGKKQLGEIDIQHIFEKNGFKVVYPEELPASEQIALYSKCKIMVTTSGTIAHNILFSNEGTELIILDRYPNDNIHQPWLTTIRGAKEYHVKAFARNSSHTNNLMVVTRELMDICEQYGWICKREGLVWRIIKYILFYIPKAYKIYWRFKRAVD